MVLTGIQLAKGIRRAAISFGIAMSIWNINKKGGE